MSAPARVFISMHYLEIGGAEAALLGMLDAWDYDRAEVDLFLYAHRGDLMRYIPAQVNLLPEKGAYSAIEIPGTEAMRRGQLGVVAGRWLAKRSFARYASHTARTHPDGIQAHIGHWVTPFLPRIGRGTYDLAISYLTPHHPVIHKVKARRKAAWIHTDYSYIITDPAMEIPMWGAYDDIVAVSDGVKESFARRYPSLRPRITTIENIMPVSMIRRRAEEEADTRMSDGTFDILTVGRFTDQKNFENVPRILSRIIEITGRRDIRWHIIGFGPGEAIIKQQIERAGMNGYIIMHGKQLNPYPFMAQCDLYVQPSLFEGKSVCVREAQALGRPVVITDFSTARSQLTDGVDGLILPLDNEKLACGLAEVIGDPGLRERLAAECRSHDYSNRAETDKIYSLIPD